MLALSVGSRAAAQQDTPGADDRGAGQSAAASTPAPVGRPPIPDRPKTDLVLRQNEDWSGFDPAAIRSIGSSTSR